MRTLVIVESPTKAKTITKYLGDAYDVRASVGHIRDLPKSNRNAIDIDGGFIPRYEVTPGKEKVVTEIKKLAKTADVVLLATDPDREGEAIAWHIREACKLKDPKRIVFHEITEPAIAEAITHPRDIDLNLLKAQEARRVLDRLVGYDLSGLIWKKVRYGLSAGRVQSPALRIIMEREREIRAFVPEDYWVVTGEFTTKGKKPLTLVCDEEPHSEAEVKRIVEIGERNPWAVAGVKQTEAKRSPRAPFITSTLQQTASSRFGFSPSRTMSIAQKLYEQGLVSYMRTDSPTVSTVALTEIHALIAKSYGSEYLAPRTYASRSSSAQEAHEAIRPTSVAKRHAGTTDEQRKLYNLIWARTVASQMADARMLRTKITARTTSGDTIPPFSTTGSVILFPGWLAADPDANGDEREVPQVAAGEPLTLVSLSSEGKQTDPPPRYTEAGLVKELEKREIGRPSTYASIIKTLLARGYVEKLDKSLKPTDTGDVVSSFLEENFASYISDSFTAEMEKDLDEIAEGKRDYTKTLKSFYKPFSKDVKSKEKIAKLTNLGEDLNFTCPLDPSHGTMHVKLGRAGKFLSCQKFPACPGARRIDGTVMEGPKETGEACPECAKNGREGKLVEREGRFGKFISCSNWKRGKNGCHYIKQSPEEEAKRRTGVPCPECGTGELVERRGRFGPFFSCSNYPTCRFIMKSRPTGKHCPVCNSLMMEGSKTIPERCSNRTCPNHNPHKLAKEKKKALRKQ
jgi:DNA topoisomerase I